MRLSSKKKQTAEAHQESEDSSIFDADLQQPDPSTPNAKISNKNTETKEEIENIRSRLQQLRDQRRKSHLVHKKSFDNPKDAIGFAMRLGVEMVAALIVGGGAGYLFDRFFETTPLALLCGLFLVILSAIINVWRSSKAMFIETETKKKYPSDHP
ncbi:MAG: AtpZ/AtpI family protein [Pseudomonadota bacterium]